MAYEVEGYRSEGGQPSLTDMTQKANGPGFDFHFDKNIGFWKYIHEEDFTDNNFMQMAMFGLSDETHGGDDVSAYAIGRQAHLISGVHEQSYLAHLVAYSACLKKDSLSPS